jgi:hypothetical protein
MRTCGTGRATVALARNRDSLTEKQDVLKVMEQGDESGLRHYSNGTVLRAVRIEAPEGGQGHLWAQPARGPLSFHCVHER